MRLSWSLQTRFLLATAALVIILCAVFAVAVHQFIELLEDELLNRTLVRQMQQFKLEVASDARARPPMAADLSGSIARNSSDMAALPRELTVLSNGVHEDIRIGGRVYFVAVDRVGTSRLYLLLDTERVDVLERNVLTAAVLLGLAALGLAAVLSLALSRAVRREQAFTEDASHELRTPLAVISSAAELLAEESGLSEAGRERVARIRRACAQMHSLIEALLFLARNDSGSSTQRCSLDRIVREAADTIADRATAKSLALNVTVQRVMVAGAPEMMACVVNNLLLNAVNFTPSGVIEVQLTPAELVVRDTGVGIPPQDLAHIFERRYRGAGSRGLGLGLYLVHRVCRRLGWTIEADSAPGSGTCFRIRLPATAASLAESPPAIVPKV